MPITKIPQRKKFPDGKFRRGGLPYHMAGLKVGDFIVLNTTTALVSAAKHNAYHNGHMLDTDFLAEKVLIVRKHFKTITATLVERKL